MTVVLVSIACFLGVLALLAAEVRTGGGRARARLVVVRRIERTTVLETIIGASTGPSGPTVTQSTSSSGSASAATIAPTTRTS